VLCGAVLLERVNSSVFALPTPKGLLRSLKSIFEHSSLRPPARLVSGVFFSFSDSFPFFSGPVFFCSFKGGLGRTALRIFYPSHPQNTPRESAFS